MKSKILIAGLICAAAIPPAAAVTKCVKLTSSTTCSDSSYEFNQSNWSATCGGVSIQGLALCGSQDGGSIGATTDTVTTGDNGNTHCWCKMVSPAVSRWVYDPRGAIGGSCYQSCAANCARHVLYEPFRSALFGSLSD